MKEWFLRRISRTSHRKSAFRLFETIVAQSRAQSFYKVLCIPDTIDGRFELVALHTFLVVRCLKGNSRRKRFGRDIMTLLFDNFDHSLREVGVGDMGIGRRIKVLADSFYGRSAAYEAGLQDKGRALEEAIARNIFRGNSSPDPTAILAAYVRREALSIDRIPEAELLGGQLTFGPAPE